MHVPIRCARIFRFGPFEFDPDNGELRKHGLKLRLVGQPGDVLALLLERKGELVRREELQQHLWSSNTFVEFDHGLNAAVMRLREVLGDSSDQPLYIETVPRRGYRFIAPLQVAEAEARNLPQLPLKDFSQNETIPANFRTRQTVAWISALVVAIAALALYIFVSKPSSLGIVRTFAITHDGILKAPSPRSPMSLVSDGARIYFTEFTANLGALYEVSAAGGEVVRLSQPFSGINLADISPDRTELLVTSQDETTSAGRALWILPQPTGPPRRVGSIFASDAVFSPDSQYIAYASYNELYKVKVDGSGQQRLITGAQVLNLPRWSPDGKKIRYTLWDKALVTSRIWEVRSDGADPHPLLPKWPKSQHCGAWTTDGTTFVFLSEGDVWTIDESFHLFGKRNPEPVRLTTGPLRFRRLLPIQGRLLVISQQIQTQIVRYDATQRQFVPILPQTSAASPNFSRDGQWLAFASTPAWDLWRSRADGSERRQLTFPPMRLAPHPRWSPDGKHIAFAAGKDGEYSHIFVTSNDEDKVEQITVGEHLIDSDPVWSPDGGSLIFARQRELASAMEKSERMLYRIELGTKQLSPIPGSKGFFHPDWSPSGGYLAAFSDDSSELMLLDFATSRWNAIAGRPKDSYWSKDGKYIYYATSDAAAGPSIMRVDIRSGKSESVLSLKDIQTSGGWIQLSLAPDDSPVIVRNAGRHDIYALELARD